MAGIGKPCQKRWFLKGGKYQRRVKVDSTLWCSEDSFGLPRSFEYEINFAMVFDIRNDVGMKREYGEEKPRGAETVTAPATVSDERPRDEPLDRCGPGRFGEAPTRESGDLPS